MMESRHCQVLLQLLCDIRKILLVPQLTYLSSVANASRVEVPRLGTQIALRMTAIKIRGTLWRCSGWSIDLVF
jgi:hypothetical protein